MPKFKVPALVEVPILIEVEADTQTKASTIAEEMVSQYTHENLDIELQDDDGKLVKVETFDKIFLDGEFGGDLDFAIRTFQPIQKQNYFDARKRRVSISEN